MFLKNWETSVLILGLCLSLSLWADNPNLDTATQIVTFPRVTVDNNAAYVNVQLLLDADGTWEIFAFEPELEPELNLTGEWWGEVSRVADFGVPLPCTAFTEISLIQNGNELTVFGALSRVCDVGPSETYGGGVINGFVDEDNISFEIATEKAVIVYNGTVSSDYRNLILLGPGFFITDDQLTWTLSL